MTKEQIDLLERLAKEATPGKWHVGRRSATTVFVDEAYPEQHAIAACGGSTTLNEREQVEPNAAFIAAANPQAILSLIALVKSQDKRIEEMEMALEKIRDIEPATFCLDDLGHFQRIRDIARAAISGSPEEGLANGAREAAE